MYLFFGQVSLCGACEVVEVLGRRLSLTGLTLRGRFWEIGALASVFLACDRGKAVTETHTETPRIKQTKLLLRLFSRSRFVLRVA